MNRQGRPAVPEFERVGPRGPTCSRSFVGQLYKVALLLRPTARGE